MLEKLKSWLADDSLFLSLVVVLIGLVSFGLGRWSGVEEAEVRPAPAAPAAVVFYDAAAPQASITQSPPVPPATAQIVVASRSGTKYHLPSCPGAAQIKPENLIEFGSPELARAAGYSPAANCPDLP